MHCWRRTEMKSVIEVPWNDGLYMFNWRSFRSNMENVGRAVKRATWKAALPYLENQR